MIEYPEVDLEKSVLVEILLEEYKPEHKYSMNPRQMKNSILIEYWLMEMSHTRCDDL